MSKLLVALEKPTDGQIIYKGRDVAKIGGRALKEYRREVQIIFQDPYSSLSPRLPISEIVGEAVREHNLVPKDQFDDYRESTIGG